MISIDDQFEENKKKLVRENKNSNRSEIKNKYISMKKQKQMMSLFIEQRVFNEREKIVK